MALKEAQQDLVDALCSDMSVANPVFWYIRLQSYLFKKQLSKWSETALDVTHDRDHPRRGILNVIGGVFRFLRGFRRHPFESLCTTFLIVLWEFCLIWALLIAWTLNERAFFVGAAGTNSRSQFLVLSILLRPNISVHVVLRWACKRGLPPYASIKAFGIVAYKVAWRHFYDDERFQWIVLAASIVWSNLVFFYSEILFMLTLIVAVAMVAYAAVAKPSSLQKRNMLEHRCDRLATARRAFNKCKTKHESEITSLCRDEFDCLLQISNSTLSLGRIYAFSFDWRLPNWSWRERMPRQILFWRIVATFKKALKSALMAVLTLLPKIGFLGITGAFFFLQVFPFRDKPLLYIAKVNWGIQVSIKMLLCLPNWRSVTFMADQASYLVMGTIYQILGLSLPTLLDRDFLDKGRWFISDSVMQVVMTNWLSELPGDLCIWCCARFSLWLIRKIGRLHRQ